MNTFTRFLLLALSCLSLSSAFTVVPKTTMMRPPMPTASLESPRSETALNEMMVDMAGGALADVAPLGSIFMLLLVGAIIEISTPGRAKK
jgi:hypothetical protein